jgi:hypothetical protein
MDTEKILAETITPREALVNNLMLDMIANTDCSWAAATAAIAFWEQHYKDHTAPVYGVVDYEDEKSNVVYDRGKTKRSLKVGMYIANEMHWYLTIQS